MGKSMPNPLIDSYHFGNIVINGISYSKDVILLPDRVISNWWRNEGHLLSISDLTDVLAAKPQALIVGQGAFCRMQLAEELEAVLRIEGIELIVLPTSEACQEYNRLSQDGKCAAALHLTC
jgi:hypothetical protein